MLEEVVGFDVSRIQFRFGWIPPTVVPLYKAHSGSCIQPSIAYLGSLVWVDRLFVRGFQSDSWSMLTSHAIGSDMVDSYLQNKKCWLPGHRAIYPLITSPFNWTNTRQKCSSWHIHNSAHRTPPHPLNRRSEFHSVGYSKPEFDCWSQRSYWMSSTADWLHLKRWRQDPRSGAIPKQVVCSHGNQCCTSIRCSLVPDHNRCRPEHQRDSSSIRMSVSRQGWSVPSPDTHHRLVGKYKFRRLPPKVVWSEDHKIQNCHPLQHCVSLQVYILVEDRSQNCKYIASENRVAHGFNVENLL